MPSSAPIRQIPAPAERFAPNGQEAVKKFTDSAISLDPGEMSLRVVGLRDKGAGHRSQWIASWAATWQFYVYDSGDTRIFSQVDSHFDSVILHGDDERRLSRIAREFRQTFKGKLLVAVLSAAGPTDRAHLFKGGADIVVDVDTPRDIVVAWLRSAAARQGIYRRHNREPAASLNSVILQLPHAGPFTPHEQAVLLELEKNVGRSTRYFQLLHSMKKPVSEEAMRALYVVVCRIKEKLPPSARIQNVRGIGYVLHMAS